MSFEKTEVLLTGASGFVGGALLDRLVGDSRYCVTAVLRRDVQDFPQDAKKVRIADIADGPDWEVFFASSPSVVVHTAARVHVMNDASADPLLEFRRVNTHGTLELARQAAAFGVRRFIFISSIKVNGEGTSLECPYTADDYPQPVDPYGISKYEAEEGLRQLSEETGLEVVIIRPPLVYGPGVKANFLNMMRWLQKGVPLPLGAIHNKRSLVALDNLVDLVVTCIQHPAAANQTFLAGDGVDLSTTELLQLMAAALDKPARLLPVPMAWLEFAAMLLGKRAFSQRLCGSLRVDIGKARELLGWQPPVEVEQALTQVARHYKDTLAAR